MEDTVPTYIRLGFNLPKRLPKFVPWNNFVYLIIGAFEH